MRKWRRWIGTVLLLLGAAPLLVACADAQPPADIAPAGAAMGRNTLIFIYTDN